MSETKKYIVVYKIVNIINNKEYVGVHRTNNINDSYLGSGKLIRKAVEKYGKYNFKKEILFIFDNDEEGERMAFEEEGRIVNVEYTLREDTYNISVGGNINPVMHGENNPFFNKKHSQELIEQIANKNRGRISTEEQRKRNSEASKEVWKREGFREKMIEISTGKKRSEKTKRLMSESRMGKKLSEETKKKLSETKKKMFQDEDYKKTILSKIITPERNKKISETKKNRVRSEKENEHLLKLNKDPEKIRKTAEKHRGMKRSAETRANISAAMIGKPANNKGFIIIHSKELGIQKCVPKDSILEDGWVRGNLKGNENRGKIWINNPSTNERKFVAKDSIIEEGWELGYGKRS